HDHFTFDGKIILELSPGLYEFEIEHGPEYRQMFGRFEIKRGDADSKEIELSRFVDMKKEGWWSGDLHVHRPVKDIEQLMRAEDLHIAPVITWWNDKSEWDKSKPPEKLLVESAGNRFYHLMAGEDEREGGALLFFNLDKPLPIQGSSREYPSALKFVEQARAASPDVHIDCEKPFWWDLPLWIASGKVHSVGLANNHMQRDGMYPGEAWGKPRDKKIYPDPDGNGRWSQKIYYELLNAGIRIPPSAGSASGVLPNPVGYNRVYVHCGEELSWDKWWEGLRAGRVVVTNGPLITPKVNGELPGHVFRGNAGQSVELQIALNLSTRDKIEYLEVIKDGKTAHEVRLDQWAANGGKLPPVTFDKSGWLLIRAISTNPKTFRFASTGPYYVEIDQQPRISKAAAQFFYDWVIERARRIKLTDEKQKAEVLEFHRQARDFWKKRVDQANAE
ncbi:MAG TPA: CehA/McbA family metallohydrolase, partial [Pirellulaceae bacterium]|nr:CehA/McbA family metallohydrolase [Pirellulaceae bacterium]